MVVSPKTFISFLQRPRTNNKPLTVQNKIDIFCEDIEQSKFDANTTCVNCSSLEAQRLSSSNEIEVQAQEISRSSCHIPQFKGDEIGLLVLKDHIHRNKIYKPRRVVYDSNAAFIEESGKMGKRRNAREIKLFGEMIFGNVDLAFKGDCIKVHILRCPPQILLSKVVVCRKADVTNNLAASTNTEASVGNFGGSLTWQPSPHIPMTYHRSTYSTCEESTAEESTVEESQTDSELSFLRSSINLRGCSLPGSFQNRYWQTRKCALEAQVDAEEYNKIQEVQPNSTKLSVSLFFSPFTSMDYDANQRFYRFFFSHFALLQSHLDRLANTVVEIVMSGATNWFNMIAGALTECRLSLVSLCCQPRLERPLWLELNAVEGRGDGPHQRGIAHLFVRHGLNVALEHFNSKENGFFLSSLLTAVLSTHLAWVPTVAPHGEPISSSCHLKHRSEAVRCLHQTNPYNPIYFQLRDSFGAVGSPLRVTKTVIMCEDQDGLSNNLSWKDLLPGLSPSNLEGDQRECPESRVRFFLYLVSYFLRCAHVTTTLDLLPLEPLPKSKEEEKARGKSCKPVAWHRNGAFIEVPLIESDPLASSNTEGVDFSLVGGVCPEFSTNFALQGVCPNMTSSLSEARSSAMASKGVSDIPSGRRRGSSQSLTDKITDKIRDDLKQSLEYSMFQSQVEEASTILASPDSGLVQVLSQRRASSQPETTVSTPARCVMSLLDAMESLIALKISPELCLRHLENCLQEIYFRALPMIDYLLEPSRLVDKEQMALELDIDVSDLPLLLSVANAHSFHLTESS